MGKLKHEHPLTHIENGTELVVCPDCCQDLDESYSCKCGSYICNLCREVLSGSSCYTCKLCWRKSSSPPMAHQSCFELPEEIRITHYRPHCLLHFEEQSDELDCHFCNRVHERFKYICGDCGFRIAFGCASKLINMHEGQRQVQHFSHRHPLSLLNFDDMKTCMFCLSNIDAPHAYGCAPCQFYIHDSCGDEFLPEILHDFHPRHSLTLQDYFLNGKSGKRCDACRLKVKGLGYTCNKCEDFHLHPKCISLKPNIKYECHQHLLILLEKSSNESQCEACGFYIEGGFVMRCVECDLNFHVQCGSEPALPPTVWLKEHKHPLTRIFGNYDSHTLLCNVCGVEIDDYEYFYHCLECEFFAHVGCSITEIQCDDKGKLRHFSHDHILILRDIHENDDIRCYGCRKAVHGSAYSCDPCQFYLHKSCIELPAQICDHQSHKHYLTLRRCDDFYDVFFKDLIGLVYRCDPCDFYLKLDCASLHPSINQECAFHEGQERIAHFSHKHHLIFFEVAGVNCMLCYKNINGRCYGCAQCEFYIHNSCTSLMHEIRHPSHPRHSLKLLVAEESGYWCKACCFDIKGLRYRCDQCNFDLHPECISLKPSIEHKLHKHPLTLVENMYFQRQCETCGLTTLGSFFMRCVECDVNFHVQCGPNSLPPTILQKQNGHRLTLRTQKLVEDQPHCIVCNKERNQDHPAYYCADFDYYAHVRCVITEVQADEREKMKHFSHQHFLFPLEHKTKDNIICCACEKDIQGSPGYSCESCKFYLHKSCAEIQREIRHPFHRHPLSLPNPYSGEYHKCNACLKHYNSFSYHCQECGFNLDLECSLLLPSIRSEYVHEHILIFFRKLYVTPKCYRCEFITPNKLTPLDSFYFRCVICDFSIHFLCSPLPQTIEHESHHHSLTLRDNFIDIFDGFDYDEYCCDYCESKRDAREPVYHCEECNFVVDFDCVFSEVMQFLEGKHKGGVQGRIISRETPKNIRGLTYTDIVESLTEEEVKLMEPFIDEVPKINMGPLLDIFRELMEMNQVANERISIELSDIYKYESSVEEFFKSITRKVLNLEFKQRDLVDVGDYKICPEFAPVLKSLLNQYGDIGSSCPFTQRLKTLPLTALCVIMEEMRHTMVTDIDDYSIILWWFHLKLVQKAGFRTDFALDHVKRIAGVHFLIDDESPIKSSPLYEIHNEIADLYKKINEQTKKIEILKKVAQDTVSSHSERSRSEANDLNETLKLSWNNAASGLLDHIPE